jgi:hypothetical protein
MSYRFERLEWKPSCPNFLPLERLHSSLSSPVARSAAELRAQKVSIGSHCERRSDHFPSEAEDIHIVIFDALMSGENIMDEPGTYPASLFAAMDDPWRRGCITLSLPVRRDFCSGQRGE